MSDYTKFTTERTANEIIVRRRSEFRDAGRTNGGTVEVRFPVDSSGNIPAGGLDEAKVSARSWGFNDFACEEYRPRIGFDSIFGGLDLARARKGVAAAEADLRGLLESAAQCKDFAAAGARLDAARAALAMAVDLAEASFAEFASRANDLLNNEWAHRAAVVAQ